MNGVSWSSSRLPVQVVALHKDSVVAQAAHPHVALPLALQLHSFANVEPKNRKVQCVVIPGLQSIKSQKNSHTSACGNDEGSPGPLDVLCSVDVAQLAQAETVAAGRVDIAVHSHNGAR